MSEVHFIQDNPAPTDRDIMLWDSLEEEWRVSHYHSAPEFDDSSGWCPMSKRDLTTAYDDWSHPVASYCVPIMAAPTHWAEMLPRPNNIG